MIEIIVDSREKKGKFLFGSYEDVTVVPKCLHTGDYSLVSYEDKITIDRKCSTGELQMCFGQQWKRFYKELERMRDFEEAYIICTFPYEDLDVFPERSTIPKYRWKYLKTCGRYLKKRIYEIEEEFTVVKFLFNDCNLDAEYQTYTILRNYYDRQTNIIEEV